MAIAGYSMKNALGGSKGYTEVVTFTASSSNTIDSSNKIELLIDTTSFTTKADVMKAIERLKNTVSMDVWPPTGSLNGRS